MSKKALVLLLLVLSLIFSVSAKVEIGSGVEIHQPGNNASINVTGSFNVTNLTVYNGATGFEGSNFSISQDTGDTVDVRLELFDPNAGNDSVTANYTANTTQSNNITFQFSSLFKSSLYEAYHNDSLVKREESTSSGDFQFFNSFWNPSEYQRFRVENTDNVVPSFNKTLFRDDRKRNLNRLEFGIDHGGESDISSRTGTGTVTEFTNTSLVLNVSLPVVDTYKVTDFKAAEASHDVDLTKTDSGLQQKGTGNFSYQELFRYVTINNSGFDSIDYNLTLENHGTLETSESWNGTVASGGLVNHSGVWSGDWIINEQNHSTKYTSGTVVYGSGIDQNYTAIQNVYVENSHSNESFKINFSRKLSTIERCNLVNSSVQELAASSTENVSFHKSCEPGEEVDWTPVTKTDEGDHFKYNYTAEVKVFTNLTDNETQKYGIPETRLDNWENRDPSGDEGYVDGSQTDVSIKQETYGGTEYVVIKVGPNHGSSSLHEGQYTFTLIYTESDGSGGSGGGSGGGGGGSPTEVVDEVEGPRFNWTLSIVEGQDEIVATPGRPVEYRLRVSNRGDENLTLSVNCISQTGTCSWVQPTVDKIRLDTDEFRSQDFFVRGRVPPDINTDRAHRFTIQVTDPSFDPENETSTKGVAEASFRITIVPVIGEITEWFNQLTQTRGPVPVWVLSLASGFASWIFLGWLEGLFGDKRVRDNQLEILKFIVAFVVFVFSVPLL